MPKEKKKQTAFARLGICVMCKEKEAKYTCPKCDVVTCSLLCVKSHKKELKCDGIRNKTEYVVTKKMDEMHLLSDYRLLEEIARCTDACTRDKARKHTRRNAPLPEHLQKFRKAVSQRGTRIYFMPKTFTKHKENTTFLDWKNKRISWKLNVTFLHAQEYTLTVDRCPEETVVEVIIEKCIKAAKERKKEYRKHFEAYEASKQDIIVLMKAEKVPMAKNKFFVLDSTKSLKENLIGKRIVEFPEIFVAVKGFYSATKDGEESKKSKLDSLLLSNETLGLDQSSDESSSEDEDDIQEKGSNGSDSSDNEDSLGNAFAALDSRAYKELTRALYSQAYENP